MGGSKSPVIVISLKKGNSRLVGDNNIFRIRRLRKWIK